MVINTCKKGREMYTGFMQNIHGKENREKFFYLHVNIQPPMYIHTCTAPHSLNKVTCDILWRKLGVTNMRVHLALVHDICENRLNGILSWQPVTGDS